MLSKKFSNKKLFADFQTILNSSIEAIKPSKLIKEHVKVVRKDEKDYLKISNDLLFPNQNLHVSNRYQEFELNKNVYVAAFGKASLGMSLQIEELLGQHLVEGIAIVPFSEAKTYFDTNNDELFKNNRQIIPKQGLKMKYFYGAANNLPDGDSVNATKQIYALCDKLTKNDVLLALISGGGSALLALPVDYHNPNIHNEENLETKLDTIKALVKSGATINQLNTVRSCLSAVKGGRLALKALPARVISLEISDVIDDPLEIISSAPTCIELAMHKQDQAKKALEIVEKFNLKETLNKDIVDCIEKQSTQLDEKIDIENFQIVNYLIGNNKLATQATQNQAVELNFDYEIILSNSLSGEAKSIGCLFAYLSYVLLMFEKEARHLNSSCEQLKENILEFASKNLKQLNESNTIIRSMHLLENFDLLKEFLNKIIDDRFIQLNKKERKIKVCLISGGETTVNLTDLNERSFGGRNQEMTLAFELIFTQLNSSLAVKKSNNFDLLFSSFGSDGIDGPTDAAGAFYLFSQNSASIDEMKSYLSDHNSYNYFLKHDRLIKTGPTGTNVSDLQVLILYF